jgi:hypothetical protein
VTYQVYDINEYTFYTKYKIRKVHIKIVVYVLILMILRAKTKTCTMVKYKRSGSLTFTVLKIPLFRCNWVDAARGVVQDKYRFISVDFNHQGYKSEPFVLAKHVAQVLYVLNTTNKRLNVVIPGKQ